MPTGGWSCSARRAYRPARSRSGTAGSWRPAAPGARPRTGSSRRSPVPPGRSTHRATAWCSYEPRPACSAAPTTAIPGRGHVAWPGPGGRRSGQLDHDLRGRLGRVVQDDQRRRQLDARAERDDLRHRARDEPGRSRPGLCGERLGQRLVRGPAERRRRRQLGADEEGTENGSLCTWTVLILDPHPTSTNRVFRTAGCYAGRNVPFGDSLRAVDRSRGDLDHPVPSDAAVSVAAGRRGGREREPLLPGRLFRGRPRRRQALPQRRRRGHVDAGPEFRLRPVGGRPRLRRHVARHRVRRPHQRRRPGECRSAPARPGPSSAAPTWAASRPSPSRATASTSWPPPPSASGASTADRHWGAWRPTPNPLPVSGRGLKSRNSSPTGKTKAHRNSPLPETGKGVGGGAQRSSAERGLEVGTLPLRE